MSTATAMNDYILVRDKDGALKYFKDGQFFTLDEIQNTGKPAAVASSVVATKPTAPEEVMPDPHAPARDALTAAIDAAIDTMVGKLQIQFKDPNLKPRFYSLIGSRLRSVRSDKEVKYMLTVPKEQGGCGIPETAADRIIALVASYDEQIAKEKRSLPVSSVVSTAPSPESRVPSTQPPVPNTASQVPSTEPRVPSPQPPAPSTNTYKPLIPLPEEEYSLAASLQANTIRKTSAPRVDQKTVGDIRTMRTLTGPLDELRTMDVANFHRLGNTPVAMAAEIKEKVAVLEQEHFPQRFEAIASWEESPLFQLFLSMGVQAVVEGRTVNEVIVERQISNTPTLTKSEFDALVQLSAELQS